MQKWIFRENLYAYICKIVHDMQCAICNDMQHDMQNCSFCIDVFHCN